MPLGKINSVLKKYGWHAEESTPNFFSIFNSKNAGVAYAELKGNKYVIKNTNNEKLTTGNKDIAEAIEKVAKEYFFAKEKPVEEKPETPAPTEETAKNSINYTWETLPADAKKISIPQKVDYKPSPTDETLLKLLKPFHAHDDIRPVMSGINFDDENIVATDSHKLVLLPNKSDYRGIFSTGTTESIGKKIDGKYPNYLAVIPYDNPTESIITVEKLYRYVVAGKKATRSIFAIFPYGQYKTNPGPAMAFVSEFLIQCLKLFLQLGIKKIRIQYSTPSKPVLMFPAEDKTWKDKLVLLMPVYLKKSDYSGEIIETYEGRTAEYGMFNKNYVPKGKPDSNAKNKVERNFITVYDLLTDTMVDAEKEEPATQTVPAEPTPKEYYYIEYLNKEKGFKKDKKYFDSNEDAKAWGIKNLENYNPDMVRLTFEPPAEPVAEPKPNPSPAPAPVEEKPAEEKPKQRALSYNQQKTLMIGRVKALAGKMTEAQVIAEGLKLMALRPDAAANDKTRTSKRRLSPTPENLIRWANNPGDFDLIGIDTIDRSANPTADYKRDINRQKLFNLFGIKIN